MHRTWMMMFELNINIKMNPINSQGKCFNTCAVDELMTLASFFSRSLTRSLLHRLSVYLFIRWFRQFLFFSLKLISFSCLQYSTVFDEYQKLFRVFQLNTRIAHLAHLDTVRCQTDVEKEFDPFFVRLLIGRVKWSSPAFIQENYIDKIQLSSFHCHELNVGGGVGGQNNCNYMFFPIRKHSEGRACSHFPDRLSPIPRQIVEIIRIRSGILWSGGPFCT